MSPKHFSQGVSTHQSKNSALCCRVMAPQGMLWAVFCAGSLVCMTFSPEEVEQFASRWGVQIQHDVNEQNESNRDFIRLSIAELTEYLKRPSHSCSVPHALWGTPFQIMVWEALKIVPVAQTRSYQQIADQIGHPKAVRAVANACGANPLALIVPCHRVIYQDGRLGGFRWGLALKEKLLNFEKAYSLSQDVAFNAA